MTSGLDAAGVKWQRAESLVRGLDYYRHTAFEFVPDEGSAAANALGSQSTVLGGGRYDGLMESLGGAPTPAVGWAAGIERLAMLVGERGADLPDVAIAVEDDALQNVGIRANAAIRAHGLSTEIFDTGSPRKRYDKAAKLRAKVLLSISNRDGEVAFNVRAASDTEEHRRVEHILGGLRK